MRRGATFVCEGDKSAERKAVTSIRWLESRYEKAVKRLTAVPVTTRILPPAPSRAMGSAGRHCGRHRQSTRRIG